MTVHNGRVKVIIICTTQYIRIYLEDAYILCISRAVYYL